MVPSLLPPVLQRFGANATTKAIFAKLDTLFVDALKTIERYEKASDFRNAVHALEELRDKYTSTRETLSEKTLILERNTKNPNWKPEYTKLLGELQAAVIGLSKKINDIEHRLAKNTKILDTKTKKEDIEKAKQKKIEIARKEKERKAKEAEEKKRKPVSIVEIFLYGFNAEAPDPKTPKSYEDAVRLIKRLERHGEIP